MEGMRDGARGNITVIFTPGIINFNKPLGVIKISAHTPLIQSNPPPAYQAAVN